MILPRKVSEKNVLPVEVHSLGDDRASALEDRHIQEILQLLHDILINAVPVKKKEETLKQQTKSGIITGSSVRIGYVFKKRPGNQLCLVPALSVTDLKAREDGEDLHSFQVLQEKVIVYAHQLYPGSPNRMSQLVKRISDKRQSTGSGVSISSYFQRVPTQCASTSQAGSSSQSSSGNNSLPREAGKQREESAPVTPPSEGRRNKIKSILKRVDEKVSKRKHRKHEKRKVPKAPVKQNKASVFEIHADDSSDEDIKDDMNTGKHDEVKKDTNQDSIKNGKNQPISSLASAKSVKDDVKSSSEVVKHETLATCSYSKALEALPSSVAQNSLDAKLKYEEPRSSISAGYEAAVKAVENKMKDSAVNSIEVLDHVDHIEAMNETSTNSFVVADVRVSEVSMLGLKIEATDPCKAGAAATLGADEVRDEIKDDQVKEVCDAADTSSDSQADDSILPTASFCTKPCNIDDSTSETDILSVSDVKSSKLHNTNKSHISNLSKELTGKESPKFKRKKSSDCTRAAGKTEHRTATKADDDKKSDPDSDSEEQCPAREKSSHSRSKHKRKFPIFSDSDSDDKLPVKKVPKTTKAFPDFSDSDSDDMRPVNKVKKSSKPVSKTSSKPVGKKAPAKSVVESEKNDFTSKQVSKKPAAKFVEPEKNDITKRGKWTFGKSLSSSEGSKKQTKLSFFMGKENQESVVDVNEEVESEDLSAGLMEELSQTPRIKRERDSSLKKEINRLSSVKDLNEEHLQHLVHENEKHLRQIFEGKVQCRRHDLYKQGAKSKRELNYTSKLGQFSDEQVDVVMESLMALFCKRHHKYLDYVMKVLLPEMLIKLHMDVHGTSHSDSETSMAQQQA